MKALSSDQEHWNELLKSFIPENLSCRWREIRIDRTTRGFVNFSGLRVLLSIMVEGDNKKWLHVSYSYSSKLPTWSETRLVKNLFIGKDKYAYIILPSEDHYVSEHPYCLHLWHCLDDNPLPDFRKDFMGTKQI